MKSLDLVLKHKWYDMIACGEKREEYRDINYYWMSRLMVEYDNYKIFKLKQNRAAYYDCTDGLANEIPYWIGKRIGGLGWKDYTHVRFHRGYTSTTMTFEIESISIGKGKEEWGAEPGKDYFVIKLGNRLKETEE